jgi:Sec-independent protein translocase protein TatA
MTALLMMIAVTAVTLRGALRGMGKGMKNMKRQQKQIKRKGKQTAPKHH